MSQLEYGLVVLNLVLGVINVFYLIYLGRRTSLIARNNQSIKELNRVLFTSTGKSNSVISRVLTALEQYGDTVNCHDEQIKQINHYLGEVLQISSLICNEGVEIDNINLIETLRERVRWYEETEKLKSQNEYYES